MERFNAAGQELFKCSQCSGWRTDEEYDKDRHGIRRKGCLPCRLKREAKRCEHNLQPHSCRKCNPDGSRRANELKKFRTYQREGGWPIMPLIRQPTRAQCEFTTAKLTRDFTKLLEEGRVTQAEYDGLMALRRDWTGPIANDDPQNLLTPFQRWGIPHGPS